MNARAYPAVAVPSTIGDLVAQHNSKNSAYQQLANVVILVSLPIAGCTLVAGIAAGLADRKRPFSLLRLAGARLSTLRSVVALEGAVPLAAESVSQAADFEAVQFNVPPPVLVIDTFCDAGFEPPCSAVKVALPGATKPIARPEQDPARDAAP